MNRKRNLITAVAIAASMATGGVFSAVLFGPLSVAAATTAATPSAAGAAAGTFHPNEDPTHEAGESAAREAQENAGQMPTVP